MDHNQRKEAYRRVFITNPEGAEVLADLVGRFYDRELFVPGGADAERDTLHRIGMRSVVIDIMRQVAEPIKPTTEDNSND